MSFATPGYLLLLLLLPPLIYLRHFWPRRGGRIIFPFGVWASGGFAFRSRLIDLLRFFAALLFWCGAASLIVALAGPESIHRSRIYLSRGVDIMFVLDESPSMFAADIAPGKAVQAAALAQAPQPESRFQAAESVIREFVKHRENDPVGLVSFARDALLRIPPTLDYRSFLSILDQIKPGGLGNGTAIGMGLGVAVLNLHSSIAPRKVIILLTDGENNAGEISPMEAAGLAADYGIRIYTIGIGGSGEAPIRYIDPETGKEYIGYLRNAFDEALLKGIAEKTGGSYFSASTQAALGNILSTIDSMESIQRRVSLQTTTTPHHRGFVVFALLAALCGFLLRTAILREVL